MATAPLKALQGAPVPRPSDLRLQDGAVAVESKSADAAGASHGHSHGHSHDHSHTHEHGDACGHHLAGTDPFSTTALLSARGLSLKRTDRIILSDVSLDIEPGEILTLIGPNGAGKTTLVRLLLGLRKPDSGSVRRRPGLRIGYAPQRFDIDQALPVSAERFLQLGTRSDAAAVKATLEKVGAAHCIDRPMAKLSGGELQRVVLARALLRKPDLLVLDEPVRGVDYVGEAELYTLIGRLRDERGFGVVLVSHDLHVVMAASDRVICLNRHVCCSGVPKAVAKHPEYARMFGADAARAFAVYEHHHDHAHDLAGRPVDADADAAAGAAPPPPAPENPAER